jgi:hypothetical protein
MFSYRSLLFVLFAVHASAVPATISGRIIDQSGLPLPGVQVTIKPQRTGTSPLAPAPPAVTDADGRFVFDVQAGDYVLTAELYGFSRIVRNVTVASAPVSLDFTMSVGMEEQVSVTAQADPIVGQPQAAAQETVTREVMDVAMLPNNTFDDVLPLLPNVVRGPDGLISVAGARAPQGQMLVNGVSANDPVLGEPDIMLPLDPIGSVQVLSNGYPSEFGRATGGVTLVEMRPASDKLRINFNSFDPRLHFASGGIAGIEAWEPNFGISGPIVKGHVWFTEGIEYRFVRDSFETLAGLQDSRYDAVLSWTSLEWTAGANHHMAAWLDVDPQKTDHANISAFTPAATVPGVRRGGWRSGLNDRVILGSGTTLESNALFADLPTRVTPDGGDPYVQGHDITSGSYFNTQDRQATRAEVNELLTHQVGSGESHHVLKAGGSIGRVTYDSTDSSSRVEELRSDGTIARTIDFTGGTSVAAHGVEAALFLQDTWTVGAALTVDAGIRYDRSTVAADGVFAPRIGGTWKLGERTTISGGVGIFSDKVLLATAAFPSMQSRIVTDFAANGVTPAAVVRLANRIDGQLLTPLAHSWHVQLDHRFEDGIITRLGFQQRSGIHEPVIDTSPDALLLRSTGQSTSRSLETTTGYRSRSKGNSVYVSYVRSSSSGDLNDFGSIDGNFKEPFVQADEVGPLAADVPNRLLVWGELKLPWRIQIAPFVEVRDGFPFSAIDDAWRFVGPRNSQRFPMFTSFDFYVNKLVKLPGRLPTTRVGVKLYNVTGTGNWRDIQRDIARPDYRSTYNPVPFEIRTIFELLWGQK